ncbi:hypothetical protein BKA82DRAFT_4018819 [Pisolithus tinctorius]|nr:hypothetical protein BKA82DRAFT_4018819 [Pisolithus tinctorius]
MNQTPGIRWKEMMLMEWRQAGKKKKPAVLLSIWEEMQGLDRNKELRGSKVQTKCKLIQDWLKKPLRSKKTHITLRSSYKYSMQAVVHKLYQEQIQEKLAKMKVEEGNTHGSKQIQQYQNALTAFIQDDLMEEQLAAAEDIVERWNGREGPAPETKARCNFMRSTSQSSIYPGSQECSQVWVQCVRLGGKMRRELYRHAHESTIFSSRPSMDFNNEIVDGIPFNDVHTLEGSCPKRAQKKTAAKATRTGKVDSVKLVKNADGEIWIGEIVGLSQDQLQKMVCRFMTAHYRLACGNPLSAVPFKNFGHHQVEMIAAHHLPEGFTFDCDPSHMWTTTATQLLSFWHKQQETHPNDPLVDRTLVPLQVVRQWKYQKTPAPKYKKNPGRKHVKGKGKAREEGVADDSPDDSLDDSLDDHGEAEGSDVGTDDPSTKKVSGRRQNRAKTPFPSRSHSNPPPADGSHTHANTPVHRPRNKALTDNNGGESNGHDSNDEADEDTYLPTLSNSKKSATSLNTNSDLHSGSKYTTELQDHLEYPDADGLESIPFTDLPTEKGSMSRNKGGKLKSALKHMHKASSVMLNQLSWLTSLRSSANVKQGIPGSTWKSPHVRKAPARPDADVPSPDAKRSCKQTGRKQKQK